MGVYVIAIIIFITNNTRPAVLAAALLKILSFLVVQTPPLAHAQLVEGVSSNMATISELRS